MPVGITALQDRRLLQAVKQCSTCYRKHIRLNEGGVMRKYRCDKQHLPAGRSAPNLARAVRCIVFLLILCATAGFFPTASPAQPYDPDLGANWRCGNLIMEKGLFKFQVVDACGEPRTVEKSYIDEYGEVEKLVYGPDAGYFYTLIFYRDRLMRIEADRR
jgi:hypothetical protein